MNSDIYLAFENTYKFNAYYPVHVYHTIKHSNYFMSRSVRDAKLVNNGLLFQMVSSEETSKASHNKVSGTTKH